MIAQRQAIKSAPFTANKSVPFTLKEVRGACHCGQIKYTARVDPAMVAVCHCTDCQTLSGTAFRVGVLAPEGCFNLQQGELKFYLKPTEEGTRRRLAFCPNCAAAIYSSKDSDSPVYWIRTGTIVQRDELTPKFQMWCRSAQSWLKDMDSLPQFNEQPAVQK